MPIYVYEEILPNGEDGPTFELLQSFSDPPLTVHPEKGTPVRRVLSTVAIAGRWSDLKMGAKLSDKNLKEKGFTKYVKSGDGVYEKSAGKGPDRISAKRPQ